VEGIARQLGGTIAVTSDGHGTAFMLRLALASPSASEPAPAPAGDRRTPSRPRPPERRPTNASILVVEESDLVRHAIVRVLRRRGYEVREAANMSLAQLDQTPSVHLVIADAVALTENGSLGAGADRARLLCLSEDVSRDGVAVLPKPFADRELLSKVEELLGPPRGASGG
jgi:CheY-like chemotaxis protein